MTVRHRPSRAAFPLLVVLALIAFVTFQRTGLSASGSTSIDVFAGVDSTFDTELTYRSIYARDDIAAGTTEDQVRDDPLINIVNDNDNDNDNDKSNDDVNKEVHEVEDTTEDTNEDTSEAGKEATPNNAASKTPMNVAPKKKSTSITSTSTSISSLMIVLDRPLVSVCLGLWVWTLAVVLMARFGIPQRTLVAAVVDAGPKVKSKLGKMKIPGRSRMNSATNDEDNDEEFTLPPSSSSSPSHISVPQLRNVSLVLTAWVAWWEFVATNLLVEDSDIYIVNYLQVYSKMIAWGGLLCFLVIPQWVSVVLQRFRVSFPVAEVQRFNMDLVACITGNLRQDVTFTQNLLADILTSYSFLFGVFVESVGASVGIYDPAADKNGFFFLFVVPLAKSVPFVIRLRQCLSLSRISHIPSVRRTQLLNFVKYLVAIPPIFLVQFLESSLIADTAATIDTHTSKLNSLKRIVVLASTTSSFYSLYWDVFQDWALFTAGPQANSLVNTNATIKMNEDSTGDRIGSLEKLRSRSPSPGKPFRNGNYPDLSLASTISDVAYYTNAHRKHAPQRISTESDSPMDDPPESDSEQPDYDHHEKMNSHHLKFPRRPSFAPRRFILLVVAFDVLVRFQWGRKVATIVHIHDLLVAGSTDVQLPQGGWISWAFASTAGYSALEISRRFLWAVLRVDKESIFTAKRAA